MGSKKPNIEKALVNLPHSAGVYKFFDSENVLIYVGKAKDLKKRVSSYFNKLAGVNRKTLRLVKEIDHLEYTVVNTEFDALLLENNLIKENQPRYNILLKDDKSFPYIVITKEAFPRVYSTRRVNKKYGDYYGPYASVKAMNNVLDLIRKLYTIRTCKLDLSRKNIEAGKYKVCLEYHIGNCLGPCENLQSEEAYDEDIKQVKHILKGHLSIVKDHFKQQMQIAAEQLNFEKAQIFKEKTDLLEKFQVKSLIVNQKLADIDVFTISTEEKRAYVNYLKIVNGTITASETFDVSKKLDEEAEEILKLVMFHARDKYDSANTEILTNIEIESWSEDLDIKTPKIGDKKKLLDLSIKNLLYYKKERNLTKEEKETKEQRQVKQLKEDLRLKELPNHIECFDNSNIQGSNPVASMVCFKGGKPSKADYRKFNIKTVVGPDDFGSMKEIVFRRYKRLKEENKPYPNLIIIDGGKGQLNAAVDSLKKLDLYGTIPIIGVAKRLEEIYYPEDEFPLHISKKSESLKLIQYLRDEAHRFAITFHRNKRSKASISSSLDEIKGIGSKTKEKLYSAFSTISAMKKASVTELSIHIGIDKAKRIKDHFNKKGD